MINQQICGTCMSISSRVTLRFGVKRSAFSPPAGAGRAGRQTESCARRGPKATSNGDPTQVEAHTGEGQARIGQTKYVVHDDTNWTDTQGHATTVPKEAWSVGRPRARAVSPQPLESAPRSQNPARPWITLTPARRRAISTPSLATTVKCAAFSFT